MLSEPPTIVATAKPFRRILLAITEDWFALSHFQPLISLLVTLADDVLVVTRSSGRIGEIAALGARVAEFDYRRGTLNPWQEGRTTLKLAAVIRDFAPDVVHLVAMKPILLGGLAVRLTEVPHTVVHLTGLGFMGVMQTPKMRIFRWLLQRHAAALLARPGNWLLVENRDDLAFLQAGGNFDTTRSTILGGAGVDPAGLPMQPDTGNAVCRAAYVGRMIHSKGVDVLMQAAHMLANRKAPVVVDLYGAADAGNPEAVPETDLVDWTKSGHGTWHGATRDIAGVWARSDIFVTPTRGGEGVPRALLEAASCGRPLIVTDVAGCREFVRHGSEGLIVQSGDAAALADAIEKLALDKDLRRRMGAAARERVLGGYTIAHVTDGLGQAYRSIAAGDEARAAHPASTRQGSTLS